ncbi:hypothetical protein [Campylobacter concisus]|uniref:hypothetical protein n=1 Tax=Campylobacter concisus TaxID=199 RepID=UPI000D3DBFCF|nr:hypothetical protein [Campylobacter concisus]QPH87932.1 hypothetical protein CVT15_04085 [Campylobacter concisus]
MRILKTLLLLCIFLIADPIEIHIEKKNNQEKYIKDLNLVGEWSIETEKYFTDFIMTAGNKWNVSFEKNQEILLDNRPRQMFWDYDNEKGKINIYNKKLITFYNGDEIILKEYIGNKCFKADLNKDVRVKICKIKGKIVNNTKELIKIEMK